MRRQCAVHVSLLKLVPTRAAFTRPGRARPHFPDVVATTQPSDSPAPSGRRSGSPCVRPATARTLLLGRTVRASANARRVGDWSSGLRTITRYTAAERQGSPRLPDRPLRPRRGPRPRRVRRRLAHYKGDDAAAFRTVENPGHPGLPFRGCATRGSGRSRTCSSTAMLRPPQQGSPPAWRAHLWPDGACTRRTAPEFHACLSADRESPHTPLPSVQALPGRFSTGAQTLQSAASCCRGML